MPGMYRPIVRLAWKGAGNVTCGYIQLEQPYDDINGGEGFDVYKRRNRAD